MDKISLNEKLDCAYLINDNTLIELKSAMIGLCTDIERYFKVAFNINLNEEIDDESFKRILNILPRFSSLNVEQFNRILILFSKIRGINAHLYSSKPIYLDEDIENFIKDNVQSEYVVKSDREITVYGAVLILILLSQRYMVWTFCTSFFRAKNFIEIPKKEGMAQFQISQQKLFNSVCGLGKPLTQNAERVHDIEYTYINEVLKTCLTTVFFDLERVLTQYKECKINKTSLSKILRDSSLFDDIVISKIIKLRNCWFHGTFIGDIVELNGETFEFTLEFAIDTLKEIGKVTKKDDVDFGLVNDDISCFVQRFFNYYVQRLIEISYKIFDNRLLTYDKLEGRLDNMEKSFNRFDKIDPKVFEILADLMDSNEITWNIARSKFLDKHSRKFQTENLKIAKIYSENGFKIGEFQTQRKEIVLAFVDLDEKFKNLVNGLNLENVPYTLEKECSKFISVVNINL